MAKRKEEVERSPDLEEDEPEEDEGMSSLFGKIISKKLRSSKKKRMAEVE